MLGETHGVWGSETGPGHMPGKCLHPKTLGIGSPPGTSALRSLDSDNSQSGSFSKVHLAKLGDVRWLNVQHQEGSRDPLSVTLGPLGKVSGTSLGGDGWYRALIGYSRIPLMLVIRSVSGDAPTPAMCPKGKMSQEQCLLHKKAQR